MSIRLLTYVLATYRFVSLLHSERGPFDVFERLRYKAGISVTVHPQSGELVRTTDGSFWADLLNCPHCLSVWCAFLATLAYYCRNVWLDAVALWLALSGAVTLIFRLRS